VKIEDLLDKRLQEQAELLINLSEINEELELIMGSTPVVKFKDKDNNTLTLDQFFQLGGEGALVTLSHFEYEIHQGIAFTFQAVDETLGDGDNIIVAFKTAKGVKVHLVAGFTTLVGGYLEIWEGPTWTTNTGTATAVANRHRGKKAKPCTLLEDKTLTPSFSPTEKVLVNPTGLNTGSATSIWKRYAWGERGKVGPGEYIENNELTLKPNSTYAVVFTAIGASNKAQIIMNWIEGTGGD